VDERFAVMKEMHLEVTRRGARAPARQGQRPRGDGSEEEAMLKWYVDRMASTVAPASAPGQPIVDEAMPHRVHVARTTTPTSSGAGGWRARPRRRTSRRQQARLRGVLTHHSMNAARLLCQRRDSAVTADGTLQRGALRPSGTARRAARLLIHGAALLYTLRLHRDFAANSARTRDRDMSQATTSERAGPLLACGGCRHHFREYAEAELHSAARGA